jgi:putative NADH-flavin reductase
MHLVLFGANGPTGRQLTDQALAGGHRVTAISRHPGSMSPCEGLTIVRADVTNAAAVNGAVAGADAVLSAVGVPYSPKPVSVYSAGTANIIAAMGSHGLKRLVVVVDPGYRASDSLFFTWVMEPLFMRRPGRTVYEDNRRMEALVRASDLDWTIVRACWLFDSAAVTDYQVTENSPRAMFTARADLAACMLACLTGEQSIRKVIGVSTTAATPGLIQQIWREVIRKPKKV